MASLSLRISIPEKNTTKMMQFNPSTSVYDTCFMIREKVAEASTMDHTIVYGLFLSDDDPKKGVWLESGRNLDYYILRNGDLLEYKKKVRTLRVRMLNGTLKTILVDDSQVVANLMVVICTKIGITNHDEYSLVRESSNEEIEVSKIGNSSTLTLKKKKEEKSERNTKMDQMKKKLKTDDEVNWIDPGKTLREQGIDEKETVLLRRKYFFSDQNIDSRDPVQLSLLYVQARDAILDGTHPIVQEQACIFAGIQCQIQFGDHKEDKHKSGFLDLKEFLPQSYLKIKSIEKKIYAEHKKYIGLSELDAKVLYTKTARSLNTYGVTFFLVKEKMKGKNKLVPRLLGVTKDSVLRLDEKTKEILQTWPLTTVRRWGASPNTFTLDFGDYSDQYYSVQTTEAEQILQLISGYIDIILKKQKSRDHFGIEGDEGSTMVEDSIAPLKATIMQHETGNIEKRNMDSVSVAIPAVLRTDVDGARLYSTGHVASAQFTTVTGQVNVSYAPSVLQHSKLTPILTEPQRALKSTLTNGQEIIHIAETELYSKSYVPELGSDSFSLKWIEETIDAHKQNIGSQIAAMNAATAQVVTLTSNSINEVDHTAVGAAIITITNNLPEVTKGVRMIAALLEDESSGNKLLDAARQLCLAFSDLLKAAEPETKEPRQHLLNAASRIGEASHQVLSNIGDDNDSIKEIQDVLLFLAKTVANTTAALVLKAKNIAATCENETTQNHVISAATNCALATSQLVACAKVVAPTLNSLTCQTQFINAVHEVTKAVEDLAKVCNCACDDESLLKELRYAATEVTKTLDDLLNHINLSTRFEKNEECPQEGAIETILDATDKLFASSGNAGEMIRQARIVGQATAQLIQSIKCDAEEQSDSEQQKKLLAAAKILAEATAKMVEAARLCASCPQNTNIQDDLRQAAEELREATSATATPVIRRKIIDKLQKYSKNAASSATQFATLSSGGNIFNANTTSQKELDTDCRIMVKHIPNLVSAIKGTLSCPENLIMHLNLINAAEQFLQPGLTVVKSAKAVLPTITDQVSVLHLSSICQQLGLSLTDLRSVVYRAREIFSGLDLDASEKIINNLASDLEEICKSVNIKTLKPFPGETVESTSFQLGLISTKVETAITQLLYAAKQGNKNYTGNAARETTISLKEFVISIRGVVATLDDTDLQQKILSIAADVISKSKMLIQITCVVINDAHNELNEANLISTVKEIFSLLDNCISCLPGLRNVDEAIKKIRDCSFSLSPERFSFSDKSYRELQTDLNGAASTYNTALSKVSLSIRSSEELSVATSDLCDAFDVLVKSCLIMPNQSTSESHSKLIDSLKNISINSIEFLASVKSLAANSNAPNSKSKLSFTSRAVTDAINSLLNICTSDAPGHIDCDNAVRNIQSLLPLLDNLNESISDASYFECLETVMENSKSLGDGMSGIANHAKKSEYKQFSEAVKEVSSSICGLIEASVQAAYLAGVSEPSSYYGKPGIVDQSHFFRAAQSINLSCQSLKNPNLSQEKIVSAATVIAKHTSALCNACRQASNKTKNPVAKRHFVQAAKEVANSTAVLIKEIKVLDTQFSYINKERCVAATKPLLESVNNLCTFASSPEFVSKPPTISLEGKKSQKPIVTASKSIVNGSCAMIMAAKSLIISPKDPPTWQLLANYSKNVSDSIKSLVASIRDRAPGQNECDLALEKLAIIIKNINAASLNIVSQTLLSNKENNFQGSLNQIANSINEFNDKLEILRNAAKYEAENIGHVVTQIILYSESLVCSGITLLPHIIQSTQQMMLLDQMKTVIESISQSVVAVKESGGNSKAAGLHNDVDDCIDSTKESLQELKNNLESISTKSGLMAGFIGTMARAIEDLEEEKLFKFENNVSNIDYQSRIIEYAKEVAYLSQELSTKCYAEECNLTELGANISYKYSELVKYSCNAIAATLNADISSKLRMSIQELGKSCIDLIQSVDNYCTNSTYSDSQEISNYNKVVNKNVSKVLISLQAGTRGTQACIHAATTVSGIIGDLDTTIMFATAGTLYAEDENAKFADHRENILKTAKALVEDTKTLVAGAASSQEQLAVAAQNAVSTIVQLADIVKFGAASLGSCNPEAQVMIINAVRDVASALGDLIHATKAASGKLINDPSMALLKDTAKIMVTNVTSLLKTVKAVEDEHTRGTRALESTMEAISQEIRVLNIVDNLTNNISPEDLIRCTKRITISTAKAVAAGNSCKQDDIVAAANEGRKSISDMLKTCKKATQFLTDCIEMKKRILQAAQEVAINYKELINIIFRISTKDYECKPMLLPASRKIAQTVAELVTIAEILKENDYADPEDPTVIAENELLGAAASIDAAAKKLANLRPRKSIEETKEEMNFDEMILEAAKSIATATSALIKAASAAQRELIISGKVARSLLTNSDDGQWSEGLISAARMVAGATQSLVESANALVQGYSSEEKLISSAKQVASSTAQLLVACKVKADPDSENTKRLQAAGNAVKRATDNLVRAAQQAIQHEEERSLILNRRIVGGIAQEINARSEVLRIEKELEEARSRLTAIRQAKYKNRNDVSDVETDVDLSDDNLFLSFAFKSNTNQEDSIILKPVSAGVNYEIQDKIKNTEYMKNSKPNIISRERVYSTPNILEHKKELEIFSLIPDDNNSK